MAENYETEFLLSYSKLLKQKQIKVSTCELQIEGNKKPLPYSSLENSMGREAWQSSVHGSMESQRVRHD